MASRDIEMAMDPAVVEEKTMKNEKEIEKIYKCLYGSNGSGGGIVSEQKVQKSKITLVVWLLSIQIVALVGNFFRMLL